MANEGGHLGTHPEADECTHAGFGIAEIDTDSMQWEKINMQSLLILTDKKYLAN